MVSRTSVSFMVSKLRASAMSLHRTNITVSVPMSVGLLGGYDVELTDAPTSRPMTLTQMRWDTGKIGKSLAYSLKSCIGVVRLCRSLPLLPSFSSARSRIGISATSANIRMPKTSLRQVTGLYTAEDPTGAWLVAIVQLASATTSAFGTCICQFP